MKRNKPKSKISQSSLRKLAKKPNAIDIRPPFELPDGDGRICNGTGQLSVRYHPGPKGQLIIEPYDGEIDIYTAPSLRELLIDAINNGHIHLIINLDSIEFLDSTGLGVLLGGLKRVRSRDGYLDLVCSQERILKIFRITGHTKVHSIFPSVQEALAARSSNTHIDVAPERIDQELEAGDWIPVRLYLTEAQHHEQIEAALRVLIEEFGLEINYEFPPFYGSYWREFGTRFRKRTTSTTEVDRHMAALERSMRVHSADQRQSISNENEAKAVAEFITALHHTSNAVIQIGTVILIKIDGTILTRNLSPLELIYYQRDPSSFKDPKAALRTLQAIAALRSGQAHGRHPKTRTIHLAQSVSPPSNESDGELVLFAQCGRTSTPLILETDSTISCGSCRNIALHRSSPHRP